jgi:hypothetical protein
MKNEESGGFWCFGDRGKGKKYGTQELRKRMHSHPIEEASGK